eukprot:CAMPEP_0183467208 /NCGR_PEP_ID=MMETSP0370-20130417/150453_1 /TAXON_ID=268820 /ORGANISM="Peridinium aciculiferum, Strain PAER-2" /LENGTH=347 /DNA_ID=CAMNT_0025659535 /DNA_START=126 /DNA_END=1166 /DNA_ORIENTATION=+
MSAPVFPLVCHLVLVVLLIGKCFLLNVEAPRRHDDDRHQDRQQQLQPNRILVTPPDGQTHQNLDSAIEGVLPREADEDAESNDDAPYASVRDLLGFFQVRDEVQEEDDEEREQGDRQRDDDALRDRLRFHFEARHGNTPRDFPFPCILQEPGEGHGTDRLQDEPPPNRVMGERGLSGLALKSMSSDVRGGVNRKDSQPCKDEAQKQHEQDGPQRSDAVRVMVQLHAAVVTTVRLMLLAMQPALVDRKFLAGDQRNHCLREREGDAEAGDVVLGLLRRLLPNHQDLFLRAALLVHLDVPDVVGKHEERTETDGIHADGYHAANSEGLAEVPHELAADGDRREACHVCE